MDTEVAVVGGGATGLGVARDCALRGLDVTLLERGRLGGGTTGHSHGVLHTGSRYADADPDGARECLREHRVLREIAGACVEPTGGLFVAAGGDDASYLEAKRAACADCGIDAELLDPAAAREHAPELPEGVDGALRTGDAVVYPSRLVAATAAAARQAGARLLEDSPVTDVRVEDGSVTGLVVDGDRRVDADVVVNAAGAWAGRVAALAGADLEMRPTKGVMVVVDRPASRILNRARPPADGDIVVPSGDRAVLGTTSEPVENPDEFPETDAEIQRMIKECRALLPGLSRADVERSYWGVRPIPAVAGEGRDASRGFSVFEHDAADGLVSVVGGKLTTHRLMGEAATDRVCERLGVEATGRTAERPLPAHDDPARLDALADEFGVASPADRAAVGSRDPC
jgi:glycerol-3-phosphate dehydrogenase